MNKEEIIKFYDEESSFYALKRYETPMVDFTQFYFRKRLEILLGFINEIIKKRDNLELLEVGCADGIIVRKIEENFPGTFTRIVGIDISSKMVEEAQKKNKNNLASFFIRGNENQNLKYDIVLEIGFLIAPILKDEILFASDKLKKEGYYMCSLSLKNSLRMLLKSKDDSYAKTHLKAEDYERLLNQHFKIIKKETYGLFVPKLWKFPRIARIAQPILESLFKYIVPGLFHERIYLLQKKD